MPIRRNIKITHVEICGHMSELLYRAEREV